MSPSILRRSPHPPQRTRDPPTQRALVLASQLAERSGGVGLDQRQRVLQSCQLPWIVGERPHLRDGDIELGAGEMYVVPRGIEHCPVTTGGEVRALLLEPAGVQNTGDVAGEMTAPADESLLD